jgi:trehalose 6-phosphate phosphatase
VSEHDVFVYDNPTDLAADVCGSLRPLLVGLDIDGVLAPIVDHADDATLTPGVLDIISDLAEVTPLAVVSGRDLAGIEARFAFPPSILVVGSHGAEERGHPVRLDGAEQDRLASLLELALTAARRAGEGAWVEQKPAAAALHVRLADPGRGLEALTWFEHAAGRVEGATAKAGHQVLEALVRPASKALAMAALRREVGAACALFVGDDVTDEEVFASFGDNDFTVRVGGGDTAARHRLANPLAVHDFLAALRATLGHDSHRLQDS